ncbi:MAG: S8 family serine peptidase, partial [Myxococcota bacterium]
MNHQKTGLLAALGVIGLWTLSLAAPSEEVGDAPIPDMQRFDHATATDHSLAQAHSSGAVRAPADADFVRQTTHVAQVMPADAAPPAVYLPDQVMIAPADGLSLSDVADRFGVDVVTAIGPAGYGAIGVPDGQDPMAFSGLLRDSGLAADVAPNAMIIGAGGARAHAGQWHLDAVRAPHADAVANGLSDFVVAVLDTGVAYETRVEKDRLHVQAQSLQGSRIVAPYDFINNDDFPGDDHQHGTHIASLIASTGAIEGVAPGVALMPLKVLDENNAGNELALINALQHAADHGADVINMSLSFHPDYRSSRALRRQLRRTHKGGVLMIAAAGNNGESARITYPAAHPKVIAVGALTPDGEGGMVAAHYSNRSSDVDLMAPGGDLSADRDRNGFVDGMLAETIMPNDAGQTGYWFYAGTSQATAMVTGAAVYMLRDGIPPKRVRRMLLHGADPLSRLDGYGAGALDIKMSLAHEDARVEEVEHHVAILPYLSENQGTVYPNALLSVVNNRGEKLGGVQIFGQLDGDTTELFSCTTDREGQCLITGPGIDGYENGELRALAWSFGVGALLVDHEVHQPGSTIFLTDDLEVLLAAMDDHQDEALDGALLAFEWTADVDPVFGEVPPSVTIVNGGTGLSSSPLGIVMTRSAIRPFTTSRTIDFDMDGTGLSSSPLGIARFRLSQINFAQMNTSLNGTGLSSSPLGVLNFLMVNATNSQRQSPDLRID